MKLLFSIPIFVCLFLNIHHTTAQTFVRAGSNCNTGCGGSWANAYPDLLEAINNTTSGEIWVAQGTYKPVNCNPCSESDKEILLILLILSKNLFRIQIDPYKSVIINGRCGIFADDNG